MRTRARQPLLAGSRATRATIALVVALIAPACGFHLQGRVPLPASLASTWIETEEPQSDFVHGLRRALLASGARLAPSRTSASAVITIDRDVVSDRVLSASALNLPREYELMYSVSFRVGDGKRELIAPQSLSVSREYSFDERAALAKQREEEVLRGALAQDLVGLVMRRLASLP